MAIYYSLTAGGFYDTDATTYTDLPNDCIEITKSQHQNFINQIHSNNKKIVVQDGELVLVDIVHTVTWNDIRYDRNSILKNCDFTQVADYPGNKEKWAKYRQLLRDIPQNFSDPNKVIWPEQPS